ncbi:MAG: hypothetical protein CMD98_06610 [Gammaproteobacteria bacterium]|nr:hypothetical protein [Gammaproteobacteria bacterium]|tara:strand:+ start:461 stop:1948 length:1488 start_codon:yes stop_codon:yes gene_type:complete
MNLTITTKNNTYITLDCDDKGILHELSEFFTFYVPGYKFMPAFRNKMWDGKLRLFNINNQQIYSGLYSYIVEFCKERDITITMKEGNYDNPDKEYDDSLDWIKELSLTVRGKKIEPRDYQLEAIRMALKTRRGMLLSPTASGKSLIIYLLMRKMLSEASGKVLIIVPTTSLVKQMYGDFADYSEFDKEWDSHMNCHEIMAGKDKGHKTKRVYISTWQSIYKMSSKYFEQFGMVVGDEAHQFKAKSLTSILTKCTEAKYRLGTTGTLDGTQTHKLVLEGLFGPVRKITTSKTLMDRGDLAPLEIDVLSMKYPTEMCQIVKGMKYPEEINYLVTNDMRNNFIKNLALDQKGNTLVLFNYVEKHGVPLFRLIEKCAKKGRKVFFVSGNTDATVREEIRTITETEKDAVLVCSFGTFSTGVNIRNLHNIIFASPSKSQIRVLQSIGRGLRKSDRQTKIYDIADDLSWKKYKNFAHRHAAERVKIYAKEMFKFKIHTVKL